MADFNNGLAVNGPLTISDEVTASVHFGSVVKAIIDDCSRHTDGGAWRKQCQGKSWFTETLGGEVWIGQQASIAAAWSAANSLPGAVFQATATAGPLTSGKFYVATSATTATEVFRGISRDYPDAVLWVAEASRVVGYDMTKPGYPMWRSVSTAGVLGYGSVVTSIAASLGVLLVGMTNGLFRLDFLRDFIGFKQLGNDRIQNLISSSSTQALVAASPQTFIVNNNVNDVAITVLDTAPTDPATGLPVPTIAVATAGGVSVIKDDGTVVSSSHTGSITNLSIAGSLLWTNQVGGVSARLAFKDLLGITAAWSFTFVSTPDALVAGSTTTVGAGGSRSYGSNAASGSDKGIALLKNNPATPAKGMVTYITNTYSSGWQVGDSRLAALADTTAETVTGSGELAVSTNYLVPVTFDNTLSSVTNTSFVSTGVTSAGRVALGFTTVVGKTYTVLVTCVSVSSGNVQPFIKTGIDGLGTTIGTGANIGVGTQSITFTATTATSCVLWIGTVVAASFSFNNISVKLAEPDRSVKNTGLVLNGTLTKAAVASGAGLVAYSGMNTSNYLEMPYNTNFDFGTGDFCVMGWVYNAGTDHSIIHRGPIGTLSANGVFDIWTYETAGQIKAVFSSVQLVLTAASNTNHFVAYVRTGGVLYGYVNGVLAGSVANTNSMTLGTSDSLYIGKGYYSTGLAGGIADRLALWRISATAPSADQIAHIYRTELPLFQPNAQCTLAGTTSSVTAMAYDEAANELHVTTAGSRSGFIDLLRVDSETLAVGTSTTVAAFEGTVITGGTTSARVYAPALNLRDELRRKEIARKALGRLPAFFDYTATASQTAFVAPKGFTVKALYKNGTLMREATTGTYWSRSNDGFQETATLSVGASVSDWISLMCVRA